MKTTGGVYRGSVTPNNKHDGQGEVYKTVVTPAMIIGAEIR